jgi:hypothetical protein
VFNALFVTVTATGEQTKESVGLGDDLFEAVDAYPTLRCEIANEGSEYETFPYCTGPTGPHVYIWLGGDPVNVIEFLDHPFDRR